MVASLVNLTGNGSVQEGSLISYSYSEDITTLDPSNLDGGTSQMSVAAVAVESNKVGLTHPNSKLLINNTMLLSDSDSGEVTFNVSKVSTNEAGIVSIVGDTVMAKLNKTVTADPYGSIEGYTLLGAIEYYCELGGFAVSEGNLIFEDDLDPELEETLVNFIGFTGNLWEHLKMLCSAIEQDIEMYSLGDALVFRKAKTTIADYGDSDVSATSIEIDMIDAAQELTIYNYETEYKVDAIVRDASGSRDELLLANENVSIADSLQVDAGEILVKRFTINASLDYVNQPVAADAIIPLPYIDGGVGMYTIAGNDGIVVKASEWLGQGGSLTVELTDNPSEIEITVIAPPSVTMPTADDPETEVTNAPYKIGVEIAGDTEYPALYITGSGVFYKKTAYTIMTGGSSEYTTRESAPEIDNPFITNLSSMYKRGTLAAQALCGPNMVLSETVPEAQPFGTTPGKMRVSGSNKFRLTSVSYTQDSTTITGKPSAQISDFNAVWTDLTFADFSNTALTEAMAEDDYLRFNEFTIIPLMEPEVVA
jgi:hypothetical protein